MLKLVRSFLRLLGIMDDTPAQQFYPPEFQFIRPEMERIAINGYRSCLLQLYSDLPDRATPQGWYISRLEIRKYKGGVEHELILATAKRTPRKHTDSGSAEELLLILERSQGQDNSTKDVKKEKEKGSLPVVNRQYEDSEEFRQDIGVLVEAPRAPMDSSSSSLNTLITSIKGLKLASDVISLVNKIPHNTKHLATLELEAPPFLLASGDPAALVPPGNPLPSAAAGPSSSPLSPSNSQQHPSPKGPKFLYLYELVILASIIHSNSALYKLFSKNCYWFAGMLIHTIRRYTCTQMTVLKGINMMNIRGDEDMRSWGESEMGMWWKVFRIVKTPSNTTLDRLIGLFVSVKGGFDSTVDLGHRKWLGDQERRQMQEDEVHKKLEEMVDRERKEKEQARKNEEQARKNEEQARKNEEQARKNEEQARKNEEQERKEKEQERKEKEQERKEKEQERKEKEWERKRADELQQKLKEMEYRLQQAHPPP